MEIQEIRTIYNLQVFRGIAAIMVLVSHANGLLDKKLFHGLFIQGYSGVDFFFLLSGFIIFYNNFRDIGNSKKGFGYIKKRFIRVLPTFWIYCLMTITFSVLLKFLLHKDLVGSWMELNPLNIAKSFFLYPFMNDPKHCSMIPPAWSLSYEIFFYFMFSLLIFAPQKIVKGIMILWPLLLISNALGAFKFDGNLLLTIILSSMNFEFIGGCLIAYLFVKIDRNKMNVFAMPLLLIGIFGIVVSWINTNFGNPLFHAHRAIIFGIPYALLIYGGILLEPKKETKASIFRKIFIFFGDASYSIYLTHFVIIYCLCSVFKAFPSAVSFFLISAITLTLGCFAFKKIEKPLLNYLRQIKLPFLDTLSKGPRIEDRLCP